MINNKAEVEFRDWLDSIWVWSSLGHPLTPYQDTLITSIFSGHEVLDVKNRQVGNTCLLIGYAVYMASRGCKVLYIPFNHYNTKDVSRKIGEMCKLPETRNNITVSNRPDTCCVGSSFNIIIADEFRWNLGAYLWAVDYAYAPRPQLIATTTLLPERMGDVRSL